MKIRMRVLITGTHDGEDWPSVGGTAEVPDDEGKHLIAGGMADPVEAAVDTASVETATVKTQPKKRNA